jgi:hypothetical protein
LQNGTAATAPFELAPQPHPSEQHGYEQEFRTRQASGALNSWASVSLIQEAGGPLDAQPVLSPIAPGVLVSCPQFLRAESLLLIQVNGPLPAQVQTTEKIR